MLFNRFKDKVKQEVLDWYDISKKDIVFHVNHSIKPQVNFSRKTKQTIKWKAKNH